MSTDYNVVCDACKVCCHLGQHFTSGWSFGYGSNDKKTVQKTGDFIGEHFNHNTTGLRIVLIDALNRDCTSLGFKDVTDEIQVDGQETD